ncbi:hypothetical protein DAPPUDRAFT_322782 [Daphnia pulex]|uniref:RRM domain-containing protein n=1 Tax=Daphnia pulex TaxID=6669 RepID=E9GWY9_DAPPU|nr:hypothetical protein DAPPUDRAFT_322782 [Daphnia pulex]|eukprot:EFX76030.1 hypothetical protein DAPPUDRAFT_322782 [Daphnia pulex]
MDFIIFILDEKITDMTCQITPKRKLFRGEQYVCHLKLFIKGKLFEVLEESNKKQLAKTDSQDLATSVIPKRTGGVQELNIVHSYAVTVTKAQTTFGGPPLTWHGLQPPQCYEVFFGNVPRDVMVEDIIPLFEDCGVIWRLRLVMNPLSTLSRGFDYVNFTMMEAISINMLNGLIVKGSGAMHVNANIPNCLYVGNIPKSKDKDEIETKFSQVSGSLLSVISAETKPNWGFCLLDFGSDIIVDWADPNEETKVLRVGNSSSKINLEDLKKNVRRACGRRTFRPAGWGIQLVEKFDDYAFVHYENRDDAAKAVEALHGHTVDGARLSVSFK